MRRAAIRSVVATAAALLLWAAGVHAGSAAAEPVAVRYAALLHDAAGALQAADVATARNDVLAASRLGGSAAALAPLIADLQAQPPDLTDAQRRLTVADAVLALPAGAVPGDDTAARRALHDVYQRPAFRDLGSSPSGGLAYWARRFGQWLLENTLGRLGRAGSLAVGGAVVAALAVLVWRRLQAVAAGRVIRAAPVEQGEAAGGPDAEWALAEAAAARGDYREAVRRAFRSALLAVAAGGRVPVNAAWTTRELLRVAAGEADLVAALAPAAAVFDHAWYSRAPVGAADWETARSRCAAIRTLAGKRSGVRT